MRGGKRRGRRKEEELEACKTRDIPEMSFFRTTVPTLCCCGDGDFAQPSATSLSIRQNRTTLWLGSPTHKPSMGG